MDRNIYLSSMELSEAIALYDKEGLCWEEALGVEWVSVPEALDRITAEPIFARVSAPFFNASAMDGIAVRAADTFNVNERNPLQLDKGKGYIPVDTGDPIVDPWDAVIMIEDVTELDENRVEIRSAASPWEHIRPVGEDIVAGELILPACHQISPIDLGALLSGGIIDVPVLKKPKVALLPTGTEIIEPHEAIEIGKIYESNSRVFEAIVKQCGGLPNRLAPVPDHYESIKKTVEKAVEEHDIVIINAGSSAGTEDFTARIIRELGQVLVHGLAIKPGKPGILGLVKGKPVIGIPGYPVSAWVVFDAVVKPLLYAMQKQRVPQRDTTKAVVSRRMVSSLKHLEVVRVKLGKVGERLIATPLSRGAGVTMSLVRADGILRIPLNCEGIEAGETVEVELFKDLQAIENTVVAIGSHDLVMDLLGDLMHTKWPGCGLSSAHVGSMAGLMALQRGEAHLAPIHLLDEMTGTYNVSYVKRIMPKFEGVLVRGVQRMQGLIVSKGNPKNISGLRDLQREDVCFINRQKGSGTRLLLDYHLKKLEVSTEGIKGYQREMITHMAVASAVQSGTADAGLGVQSAAEVLGLDFIPVGVEAYDFLVPKAYMTFEPIVRLIETLKSEHFCQRVLTLGGYTLDAPGQCIPL